MERYQHSLTREDRTTLSKQLQETEERCVALAAAASHHAAVNQNLVNRNDYSIPQDMKSYLDIPDTSAPPITSSWDESSPSKADIKSAIRKFFKLTKHQNQLLADAMHAQEETIAKDRQLLADPKTPRKKFWAAYQRLVLTVESKVNPWTHQDFTLDEREDHAHTGFLTELGEILDIEKKHQFYGKPHDINHITEEIGDLLWYAALYSWVCFQQESNAEIPTNCFLNSKKETGGYAVDSTWIIKDHIKCVMGRISNWNSWAADTFMPEVRMVRDMYRAHGCDIPPLREIARRNIFKLLDARYKSGSFSQEEAVNRDLADEAEKLRGTGVDGNSTHVPEPTEDSFLSGLDEYRASRLDLITPGTGQDPDTQAEFDPEDVYDQFEAEAAARAEEGFAPDEPLDDE